MFYKNKSFLFGKSNSERLVIKENKKKAKLLIFYAKKLIDKAIFVKIKKTKDLDEQIHLLEYSLKVALEKKIYLFRQKIKLFKSKGIDVFFISIKVNLLNLKIKYFNVTHNKRDFKIVIKLIEEVEKEIKNV
ncbi:MAG TPA: hypothetical protein VJB35_05260 [Candidatus Nanoarchaeia archaeon]|nr:hypothetical protein [Candidatus Nanoarchaeia archaeon]